MTEQKKNTHQENSYQDSLTKIWDLPTRIFHWLLVVVFAVAYFSNRLGVDYFIYHLWSGYFLIILLFFRLLWGIFGTHHAKFSNFVRSPKASFRYLLDLIKGKSKPYPGHNPLGALMVLLLLITLLIQVMSGLFANDEILNAGPLYAYVSHEFSLWLTGIHKELFYWIFAAVVLHVIAVFFYWIVKKENLIKAMITGKKTNQTPDVIAIKSSRIWLALFLILILSAILAAIIVTAPEAVLDLGY